MPLEHIGVYSSALLWLRSSMWEDRRLQVALYDRSVEETLAQILHTSTIRDREAVNEVLHPSGLFLQHGRPDAC